jgi:VWFA-related protein
MDVSGDMSLLVRSALLFVAMGLCCCMYGQDSAPVQTDAGSTIHVSTKLVILDAEVENKKTGSLIGALKSDDFVLSEDGVPQQITYFSHDQLPLSVIFLFDLTQSVRPALASLGGGAREVLGHLKPQDEVAVMVFSSHAEVLQGFTTDRSLAADAIGKASNMKTGQGTFIHESMYEAVDEAMKSTTPGSRKVTVWLTDGTANFENSHTRKTIGSEAPAYLHTKEEATASLLRSGVVVSALIDRTAETDAVMVAANVNPFAMFFGGRMGDIRKYADLTGGPVLNTSKKEVADRLAELIDQLRGRYTLGYKPTNVKPDGTFCKLELRLKTDAHVDLPDRQDIVVRTRAGYFR